MGFKSKVINCLKDIRTRLKANPKLQENVKCPKSLRFFQIESDPDQFQNIYVKPFQREALNVQSQSSLFKEVSNVQNQSSLFEEKY
jgi:hypothetical protein